MEDISNKSGLNPEYKKYDRQACFVGHSHDTDWRDDLIKACAEVLPKYCLQPWYADDYFDPTQPLREKVVQAIANARFGIYDISSWQDKQDNWHDPRNVYIELGMAIALNRPTLLLRHTSNNFRPLPACLKGVKVLEFSGEITLKKALEQQLPQWINVPPERDWFNRFCIFGNRVCGFREEHPRAHQFGKQKLSCHISDGFDEDHCSFQPQEREEIRGAFEDIISRYDDLEFNYLDQLSLTDGYQLLLCSYCQNVRSTPFAIYRILPNTPAAVFITIGISLAMESLFKYKIPKVLLVRHEQDLPSLLRGYEVVEAVNSREAKRKLKAFIPAVTQKVRETTWKPRPLPFNEHVLVLDVLPEQMSDNTPIDETLTGAIGRETSQGGLVESIRRWIDGENAEDPLMIADEQSKPRRVWEEFLVKVAREVEAVMQREMFTPPGGLTYIPREYIIYLSNDDDKDWQGDKRRGLEQGLFHILSERARELAGRTQLATKSFAVELRVDGTLNRGEFRVQPVWDETEAEYGQPIWDGLLMQIMREVEAVMQREMFTPPGGLTYIPREYIIYLSNDDDKDWQGDKRRGLERDLYEFISKRALSLAGSTKMATISSGVEFRIDGSLNKGEFHVQPVWDEDRGAVIPKQDRFKVGQKVVYPNHGIGIIEQIEEKQIGATSLPFYTVQIAGSNSPVLVPVTNASEVGLRAPISSAECDLLLKRLADDFTSPANDEKDRLKDFTEKMRTGDIFEVADVLKNLTYLSHLRPLSFREQRMLERARYLVISELAAVSRQPESNVEPRIDQAIARACAKHDGRK